MFLLLFKFQYILFCGHNYAPDLAAFVQYLSPELSPKIELQSCIFKLSPGHIPGFEIPTRMVCHELSVPLQNLMHNSMNTTQ